MVRVAKRGSAAFLAASLFFSMAPARADEPSPTDQARLAALLRKAETAAKARQWEACVQAYTEAMAIEDAPRTAGELGLCEEQLHRFADAHKHLDRAMDAAPTDPTAAPWKHYQAAMVRLRERVAILFITVSQPDAAVVLDGRPIGRADGRHVALEPGPHTITARLRGYEDATRTLTVIAPSVPHVDLELKRIPQPAPSPSAASERRPAAPSSPALATTSPAPPPWYMPGASPRGVLVPLAAVGVATALVSGATSIALEVDRASVRGSLNTDTCSAAATSRPAICDTLAERYDQRNIAFGVAIGATITSGLLAGAAGIASRFERDTARPQVAPAVSVNGGGIVVVGSW